MPLHHNQNEAQKRIDVDVTVQWPIHPNFLSQVTTKTLTDHLRGVVCRCRTT